MTGESSDNRKLIQLQARYLETRSESDLGALYTAMTMIALRMIKKMCEAVPGKYSDEDREEKSHNAAVYIIIQYQTRPDFYIKKSVTGYLYKRCQRELFYRRKIDALIQFSSATIEMLDNEHNKEDACR
ncbi:MAG: hypothetical protein EWM51_03665 [Treponema sp.]|nr:MAG: hypothetical protein EWM51_03665 [Treponema sp.]